MTTVTRSDVTDVAFYGALARRMNIDTERFRVLGDADMVAIVSVLESESTVNVQLVFAELACAAVDEASGEDVSRADFRLVGPRAAWEAMFADILAHGGASGEWTINSLALRGDRIHCEGDDPMGLDKFSRFNQTLQEFFDGASRLGSLAADTAASTTRSNA